MKKLTMLTMALAAANALATMWTGGGEPNQDGSYKWGDKANWGGNAVPLNSGGVAEFPENCTATIDIQATFTQNSGQWGKMSKLVIPASSDITFVNNSGTGTNSWMQLGTCNQIAKLTLDGGARVLFSSTTQTANGELNVVNGSMAAFPQSTVLDGMQITVSGGSHIRTDANAFANLKNGAKITVTGTGSTFWAGLTKMEDGTIEAKNGAHLEFRSISELGTNAVINLDAATAKDVGTFYVNSGGAVNLKNGSAFYATSHFKLGMGFGMEIDDSLVSLAGGSYQHICNASSDPGGNWFRFKGANPKLVLPKALSVSNSGTAKANGIIFEFDIPEGGYAETPVQNTHATTKLFDGLSNANAPGFVHLKILGTSAALTGTKTDQVLISSTPGITAFSTTINPFDFAPAGSALGADDFRVTKLGGLVDATAAAEAQEVHVTIGSGEPEPTAITESKGVTSTGLSVSKNGRAFTLSSAVLQLADATGYSTRIRVVGGATGSEPATIATFAVTEVGAVQYVWNVSDFAVDYSVKFVLETLDGDSQVVYTEETPVVHDAAADSANYVWQKVDDDWNGSWTDTAHWKAITGDYYGTWSETTDCIGYPNSASSTAYFPSTTDRIEVTLNGEFNVKQLHMRGYKNLAIVTNSVGGTTSKLTAASGMYTAYNTGIVEFDGITYVDSGHCDMQVGKSFRVKNGAVWNRSGGNISQSTRDSWIEVLSGSLFSAGKIWVGAGGQEANEGGLLISNATVRCSELCGPLAKSDTYGWGYVRFRGESPRLEVSSGCYSETDQATTRFDFEVPKGGYAQTPFVYSGTGNKVCFSDEKNGVTNIFMVAESSPALRAGKADYPLLSWNASGINLDKVVFAAPLRRNGSPLCGFILGTAASEPYGWQPVADFTGTAVSIGVHMPAPSGLFLMIK